MEIGSVQQVENRSLYMCIVTERPEQVRKKRENEKYERKYT